MKLFVRAAFAQVMVIVLLLPIQINTMAPPSPGMDRRSNRFDENRRMDPREMYDRQERNRPEDRMREDNMHFRGAPSQQNMNQDENMSPDAPEQNDTEVPTQVVSGLDTDFKEEQESIDHAIDTINAKSGGNWLLKRVWWEKTEEVYEQIKEVFNKVMDTRMRFIAEYNQLNRSLDIFYSEIGIEQGPLRDLLSHAQDLMDKEQKEQGYLNKREQAFVFKLKGKERDLEQLKLDVKAIQELDAKLDEAFEMLFKQIDVCNQYEQKAWDNFKEIARELNDKEARKLYYDTEGLYKDIQKVSEYISGAFSTYFNQTIQSAHDHTTKISSQMNVLKNEGIDLVKQAEVLEKEEEPEPKKVIEKPKTKQKKGWWNTFKEHVEELINMLLSYLPKSVRTWFVKEEKVVDPEYNKLKKEGESDLASLEKEFNNVEKIADADAKSVEKVASKLETSAQSDAKLVEQEAKKIEDSVFGKPTEAEKKELGIDDASKNKPSHLIPVPKAMPIPSTLPAAPDFDVHHRTEKMQTEEHTMRRNNRPSMRSMKEQAVEQMSHRPAHEMGPRRSITEHFQPSYHAQKPHVEQPSAARPEHELHNMRREEHPEIFDKKPEEFNRTHGPEHDSNGINALNPGTLGS